jgi:hypothetical protein
MQTLMKKQRNWSNELLFGTLLVFSVAITAFATPHETDRSRWVDVKKRLSYSYILNPKDKISINNQFGDVKMKIWDQNAIKVDILITGSAPTEGKAREFVRMVDIINQRTTGQVNFQTVLDKSNSTYKNNLNWALKSEDKNQLSVDYLVYLPKNHALIIDNSFGDIYLPNTESAVQLKQNHGTLFAEDITNNESNVEINYGKAFIKSMHGGELKAEHSVLHLNEANKTRLQNKFGNLQVKELIDVDGIISYSTGFFETIKEAANFKIDFSDGLRLGTIDEDVKVLELDCNYSSIELPVNQEGNYDFDVKTVNGKVIFPQNREVRFLRNSDTDDKNKQTIINRFYSGSIGEGTHKTKVIIKSSNGSIRIK